MNAQFPMYRLSPRGGGGLSCDKLGVALGPAALVRATADGTYEAAPPLALARLLSAAYGPQPDSVVERLHRGLARAARALKAGDLALAGIETVLLSLPDPTPQGLATLTKWGDA